VIAYKPRQTHFIELERGSVLGIIVRNFEEIYYVCTVARLHLRPNNINSGPFSVYVYENATPQTLCFTEFLPVIHNVLLID